MEKTNSGHSFNNLWLGVKAPSKGALWEPDAGEKGEQCAIQPFRQAGGTGELHNTELVLHRGQSHKSPGTGKLAQPARYHLPFAHPGETDAASHGEEQQRTVSLQRDE